MQKNDQKWSSNMTNSTAVSSILTNSVEEYEVWCYVPMSKDHKRVVYVWIFIINANDYDKNFNPEKYTRTKEILVK
jgi:hypothetical protein